MLHETEPAPFTTHRPSRHGPVLLTCEHAGREIPASLGDLGVPAAEMERHIAWDIGALELARALSETLQARLVASRYSRLVVDCNRSLRAPDLMPAVSDGTHVPANRAIEAEDRQRRIDALHRPYHQAIEDEIDSDRPLLLVAVHSFTPRMNGSDRPWHCGFLANRRPQHAEKLLAAVAQRAPALRLAVNEPYTVDDISDYTIPVHGEQGGIPHVLVEMRNDQLTDDRRFAEWVTLLTAAIGDVVDELTKE